MGRASPACGEQATNYSIIIIFLSFGGQLNHLLVSGNQELRNQKL